MSRFGSGLLEAAATGQEPAPVHEGYGDVGGHQPGSVLRPRWERFRRELSELPPLAWASDVLITLSVLMGLLVYWDVGWSNVQAAREQTQVTQALTQAWSAPRAQVADEVDPRQLAEGEAFARMHIPSFGPDWEYSLVSGISMSSLMAGPGFYPGSQAPGDSGNTAVAGHRDGRGAPFHDLDTLATCDTVVVETQSRWLTYRVLPTGGQTGNDYADAMHECLPGAVSAQLLRKEYNGLTGTHVTTPTDVDVVAPVPGDSTIAPQDAALSVLTLTTCHPIWSNAQRLIIHAVLEGTDHKADHPEGWTPAQIQKV